ncbi:MAG TPA: Crp/Fnr family transcriptional regulator [Isosphaeraceae bacterium]|nr:Crp/Fnr family transcriptional regulator [Isosphaeraceae bacterium]
MSDRDHHSLPAGNRLLASLPEEERDRVTSQCEQVPLRVKDLLHEVDSPIPYVYFPRTGVISVLLVMENGLAMEVGTVGNEGMVGVAVFLGASRSPLMAIVQIPGEALRMEAEAFREELRLGGSLHSLMHRYTQVTLKQTSQLAACNHLHSVEERMCRWLLMAHDRVESDEFPLTQEFLAEMLVVRRPSVTVIAGALQRGGLIRYSRGKITVLDRAGLEAASCECYRVFKEEHDRILS